MKLRRITPNPSSEYKWEGDKPKYAVIYKDCVPHPVIAVFDSMFWADRFVETAAVTLEIMEIDYDS